MLFMTLNGFLSKEESSTIDPGCLDKKRGGGSALSSSTCAPLFDLN